MFSRYLFPVILILSVGLLYIAEYGKHDQIENDQASISQIKIRKIDSICHSFIERGNTIGFSIGILKGDRVVFSKGYGVANLATGQNATDSTIYPIASVSKFITAIITMQMMEEKLLSLEDKVTDYFEHFPSQPGMAEITIEHLLRHQSGLIDHEDWMDSLYINHGRAFTSNELLKFINQPLFFRPGTSYSYSNTGYALLSEIIEQIEGKSFDEVINARINEKLGTKTVRMWPKIWAHPYATIGYELADHGVDTSRHSMTEGMKGDGGLAASVIELMELMKGLTNGKLISERSLDLMLTPSSIKYTTVDYGLGVKFGRINEHFTFGHSGGYKGTGWTILTHYPDDNLTFAAAINTNFSPDEVWLLRSLIIPIILDLKPPQFEDVPIVQAYKYTDTFRSINRWGKASPSMRVVFEKNGRLFWDNPLTPTPGAQLYQMNDSIFSWKKFPYDQFRFHFFGDSIIGCSQYIDGTFIGHKTRM